MLRRQIPTTSCSSPEVHSDRTRFGASSAWYRERFGRIVPAPSGEIASPGGSNLADGSWRPPLVKHDLMARLATPRSPVRPRLPVGEHRNGSFHPDPSIAVAMLESRVLLTQDPEACRLVHLTRPSSRAGAKQQNRTSVQFRSRRRGLAWRLWRRPLSQRRAIEFASAVDPEVGAASDVSAVDLVPA